MIELTVTQKVLIFGAVALFVFFGLGPLSNALHRHKERRSTSKRHRQARRRGKAIVARTDDAVIRQLIVEANEMRDAWNTQEAIEEIAITLETIGDRATEITLETATSPRLIRTMERVLLPRLIQEIRRHPERERGYQMFGAIAHDDDRKAALRETLSPLVASPLASERRAAIPCLRMMLGNIGLQKRRSEGYWALETLKQLAARDTDQAVREEAEKAVAAWSGSLP